MTRKYKNPLLKGGFPTSVPSYPLSPTSLDASACPHRYKEQYIQGKRGRINDPNHSLKIGKLFHEFACNLVNEKKMLGHDAYLNSWDKMKQKANSEIREELYYLARNLLFNFPEDIKDVIGAEIKLGVDKDFKPIDFDHPKCFIRGIIDRLMYLDFGRLMITDYKTDYLVPSEYEIRNGLQSKIYTILIHAHYSEVRVISMQFFYIRYLEFINSNFYGCEIDKFKEDIKRKIETDIEKISKAKCPEACAGIWCATCPVKCPLPDPLKRGYLQLYDEARSAAYEYQRLRQKTDVLTDRLSALIRHRGPIRLNSGKRLFTARNGRLIING